jgi:cell division transport system permease protein
MTPFQRAWRGSKSDWRLHALSVFSVAVGFVCLTITALIAVNFGAVQERWAKSGRASVYLQPSASKDQVQAIDRALRKSSGVTSVKYLSSEEARRELTDARDDELLSALPAEAFPASLEVALADDAAGARLDKLAEQLRTLPAVEAVETYGAWSDRLSTLLAGGTFAALLLSVIVFGAVVSIVSSTIRLALQRRKIEVEVLKLVGASDGYVRGPYVIEGAAQGALGAALALLLVGILYLIVREHFDGALAALLGINPTFLPWWAALVTIAVGAALGALASFTSLRRLLAT